MNKNQNSLYLEDWKVVARKDWERVNRNLEEAERFIKMMFPDEKLNG